MTDSALIPNSNSESKATKLHKDDEHISNIILKLSKPDLPWIFGSFLPAWMLLLNVLFSKARSECRRWVFNALLVDVRTPSAKRYFPVCLVIASSVATTRWRWIIPIVSNRSFFFCTVLFVCLAFPFEQTAVYRKLNISLCVEWQTIFLLYTRTHVQSFTIPYLKFIFYILLFFFKTLQWPRWIFSLDERSTSGAVFDSCQDRGAAGADTSTYIDRATTIYNTHTRSYNCRDAPFFLAPPTTPLFLRFSLHLRPVSRWLSPASDVHRRTELLLYFLLKCLNMK